MTYTPPPPFTDIEICEACGCHEAGDCPANEGCAFTVTAEECAHILQWANKMKEMIAEAIKTKGDPLDEDLIYDGVCCDHCVHAESVCTFWGGQYDPPDYETRCNLYREWAYDQAVSKCKGCHFKVMPERAEEWSETVKDIRG